MTAKEMFEELGYEVFDEGDGYIYYEFNDNVNEPIFVEFGTHFAIYRKYSKETVRVGSKELKAIFQQCKELGLFVSPLSEEESNIGSGRGLTEKETPKRLNSIYYKVHKNYDEYFLLGYCPVCGNEFQITKRNKPNYCSNCGQRIDWDD